MAIVFLPRRPKAPGDTFAYFFNDTCIIWSSYCSLCISANESFVVAAPQQVGCCHAHAHLHLLHLYFVLLLVPCHAVKHLHAASAAIAVLLINCSNMRKVDSTGMAPHNL